MSIDMPSNPSIGYLFTAQNSVEYLWDGEKWVSVGSLRTYQPGAHVGPTPPPGAPSEGALWFNTINGILYVYYEDQGDGSLKGQWVDTRPIPDNIMGIDGDIYRQPS